jgi:hypothetical protein
MRRRARYPEPGPPPRRVSFLPKFGSLADTGWGERRPSAGHGQPGLSAIVAGVVVHTYDTGRQKAVTGTA